VAEHVHGPDREAAEAHPVRRSAPAHRAPSADRPAVPALARVAGNKAFTALVRGRGPVVQRHASWEHQLMGDTKPADLAAATGKVAPANRSHVLNQELARLKTFRDDPRAVPRTGPGEPFEGIQVVRLAGSSLYVTYGELNALGDYLPNGEAINSMTAAEMIPILQHMRHTVASSLLEARDGPPPSGMSQLVLGTALPIREQAGTYRGEQSHSTSARAAGVVSSAAEGLKVEDDATAGRGFQRYTGLLSRNACHFAPMSWERWTQNHSRAVEQAKMAYGYRVAQDGRAAAAETQAWVDNGYADHFLEDSFAAGHLINKTLVMQWFMEYARANRDRITRLDLLGMAIGPVGIVGASTGKVQMPDAAMVRAMGTRSQRRVAGQDIYQEMRALDAQYHGRSGVAVPTAPSTDFQTASEFRKPGLDATDRAALAGVDRVPGMTEGQVAHQYQEFLANAFLQKAAGEVHDHFNALTTGGLLVENGLGMRFRVGGDDTQLALSDPRGAQVVVDAVNWSRQMIAEIVATGQSTKSPADVLMLVPAKVVLGEQAVGLEAWNLSVVRRYCDEIFPDVFDSLTANAVRIMGALPSTPDPDLAATN
jgi:hypothetical protein